jgi:hypothetical protein
MEKELKKILNISNFIIYILIYIIFITLHNIVLLKLMFIQHKTSPLFSTFYKAKAGNYYLSYHVTTFYISLF